jgi:hypothetical protein
MFQSYVNAGALFMYAESSYVFDYCCYFYREN